jgi:hypothetical protein
VRPLRPTLRVGFVKELHLGKFKHRTRLQRLARGQHSSLFNGNIGNTFLQPVLKILQILQLKKKDRFQSKLVHFVIASHFLRLGQTRWPTTESVLYESVMFYSTRKAFKPRIPFKQGAYPWLACAKQPSLVILCLLLCNGHLGIINKVYS